MSSLLSFNQYLLKLKIAGGQIKADILQNPQSYKVGIVTIALVTCFLALIISITDWIDVIYIRITENNQGDADLIWTPEPWDQEQQFSFLNYTDMEQKLQNHSNLNGITPRWYLTGNIWSPNNNSALVPVYVFLIDSQKEIDIGLGRKQVNRELGPSDCYINVETLKLINQEQYYGKYFHFELDFLKTINLISQSNVKSKEQMFEELAPLLGLNLSDVLVYNISLEQIQALYGIKDPTIYRSLNQQFDLQNTNQTSNNGTEQNDTNIEQNEQANLILSAYQDNKIIFPTKFTISQPLTNDAGKWPSGYGNVIGVEAKHFIRDLKRSMQILSNVLVSNESNFQDIVIINRILEVLSVRKLYSWAFQVVGTLQDRDEIYLESQRKREKKLIDISDEAYEQLGNNHQSNLQAPISLALEQVELSKMFLRNVMINVILVTVLLSIILIYSLQIADQEKKAYEVGMIRAIGMKKEFIILQMMYQALYFSFYGALSGVLIAFLINLVIIYALCSWAYIKPVYNLTQASWALVLILGFVIPQFSNFWPIKRALGKSIKDALDRYRIIISELYILTIKLEKMGLSPPEMVISVLFIIIGFITYYVIPLTYSQKNMDMFFLLLNLILMFLILGISFLTLPAQRYFQNFYNYILFKIIKSDKQLKKLVSNQLLGHEHRNWKTAFMLTIALAFLIFSGTGFALQQNFIRDNLKVMYGSDLFIQETDDKEGLKEKELRQFLEFYQVINPDQIENYTFVTFSLDKFQYISKAKLSPLCGFPEVETNLFGIEQNYLYSTYENYFYDYDIDIDVPNVKGTDTKDGVYALYSNQKMDEYNDSGIDPFKITIGQNDIQYKTNLQVKAIMPLGLQLFLSMDLSTPFQLKIVKENTFDVKIRGKTRVLARKFPGAIFSGYRSIAFSNTQVFVPMDNFLEILKIRYAKNWPKDIPQNYAMKEKLLVKLKKDVSSDQRQIIANQLRNVFQSDTTLLIDVQSMIDQSQTFMNALEAIFIIIGLIAMILAFFLLYVSFRANIRENIYQFGVLRAIGLSSNQIIRLHIYEAFILTLTAVLLGTIVGIIVAVILNSQFDLFTEMPFTFGFPVALFLVMLLVSFACAILGSYFPAKEASQHTIADLIQGNVF